MTRLGRSARALAVALVVGLAAPASAAPSAAEREARHRFDEGEALYRAGHYADALAKYQAGYDADPLAGFLINIAQCQRRLGDLTKARATYQKFVMVAPDSPHVPEVTTLIAELDKLIADLERPASETADGAPPPADAEKPVPAAVPPPATAPVLVAAPPPAPAASEPPRRRWWLWGLAGVAVAGAGATIAVIALSSPGTTTLHEGSLGTLRR